MVDNSKYLFDNDGKVLDLTKDVRLAGEVKKARKRCGKNVLHPEFKAAIPAEAIRKYTKPGDLPRSFRRKAFIADIDLTSTSQSLETGEEDEESNEGFLYNHTLSDMPQENPSKDSLD